MNDKEKPMSIRGEEDDVMDRGDKQAIDRLIICALARSASAAGKGNADLAALTPEDEKALDGLGTSEELIGRILSRAREETSPSSPTHRTTQMNLPTTDTHRDAPREAGSPGPDYHQLMDSHDACHLDRQVGWSCQYRKKKEIGRGGQGVVYLIECLDGFYGQRALKVFSPEPYRDAQAYREDMQRLTSVAAVVHQNRHDNLIEVDRFAPHNDVDDAASIYVMVMRLIDGYDVERLLQPDVMKRLQKFVHPRRWADLNKVVYTSYRPDLWSLTPGIAVNIIEKCLRALSALHEKDIVHGDVKPSNIMLDCYGSIRLIDIGSAFQITSPPQQHALTPRYAPPEVLEGGEWTPQSDLASLGYVLIDLLSGQPELMGPHASSVSVRSLDEEKRKALLEAKRRLPDRLEQLIPQVALQAHPLKNLCTKLIRPNPKDRFACAVEAMARANEFKDQLAKANLAVHWVEESKLWVTDVKRSTSTFVDHG